MHHTCHTSVASGIPPCYLKIYHILIPKISHLGSMTLLGLVGNSVAFFASALQGSLCKKSSSNSPFHINQIHILDGFLGAGHHSTVEALWKIRAKFSDPVTTRPVCSSGSESVCVPQVTAELLIFMLAKLQAGRLIRWYVFSLGLWGQVELPH